MTKIAIVGGGNAATLHADAALRARGVELLGVGGRPGTAARLAEQAGTDDLPLDALCRADAVVVAVPPDEISPVLRLVEHEIAQGAPVGALLIEGPVSDPLSPSIPAQLGANLLYAPGVRRGLRAIDSMTNPHHLVLRTREPRPHWNVGPLGPIRAPGLRVLPLLMSAAGEAATEWVLTKADSAVANATIGFASGRAATIEAQWSDTAARTELEVADQHGVTVITVDPLPRLEIDGHPVDVPAVEPIEALGFVAQIERLAQVAAGRVAPWPDLSVGSALWTLVDG